MSRTNKDVVTSREYPEDPLKLLCIEYERLEGRPGQEKRLEAVRNKIIKGIKREMKKGNRIIGEIYKKEISSSREYHTDSTHRIDDDTMGDTTKAVIKFYNKRDNNRLT